MTISFSAGDVLEHVQLNNLIIAAGGDGVLSGLAVSQKGTGANMSVDVALGECRIGSTIETESGPSNVVIDAAHATLHRKDIITYDPTTNAPTVTKGTDHAGGALDPIYPQDIPAGDILLAIVAVDATAGSIVNADITDCRVVVQLLSIFDTIASDDLRYSDDSVENIPTTSYTKIKELDPVPAGILNGTLRIKFAMNQTGIWTSYGQIYCNGVAVGTQRSNTGAYATYSEDITGWTEDDTIELWARCTSGTGDGNVKEFRAYGASEEATVVPAMVW